QPPVARIEGEEREERCGAEAAPAPHPVGREARAGGARGGAHGPRPRACVRRRSGRRRARENTRASAPQVARPPRPSNPASPLRLQPPPLRLDGASVPASWAADMPPVPPAPPELGTWAPPIPDTPAVPAIPPELET